MTATKPEVTESAEYHNPDEVLPQQSPLLKPQKQNLIPSPSPSPDRAIPMSRSSSSATSIRRQAVCRKKIRASQGDGILIAHLSGGKRIEISRHAAIEPLASDDEMDEGTRKGVVVEIAGGAHSFQHSAQLAALAAGALAHPAHNTPELVLEVVKDGKASNTSISEKSSAMTLDHVVEMKPEPEVELLQIDLKRLSPMRSPGLATGELAPIQEQSPKFDKANGNVTLPSINAALGNLKHLAEPATGGGDKDSNGVHRPFSQSPPRLSHFAPANGQPSPPISPAETFQRRELPSPRPGAIITTPYYHQAQAHLPRPSQAAEGYSSPSTVETPSTESGSGPTPASSTATIADRMSIDGITHPQVGGFQCEHPGCTAAPFQTQYLLNSHANVHSSSRPHYCMVKGCARSEGGKGFKRKNEMIRHGLVHDSPGYVCPFCPDREHKYPRPDNLQRHVRVHHVDKDKDDPNLRDVLSQRPQGPNRGRRRRGGMR